MNEYFEELYYKHHHMVKTKTYNKNRPCANRNGFYIDIYRSNAGK